MFFLRSLSCGRIVFLSIGLLTSLTSCISDSPPTKTPLSHLGQLKKKLPYNLYVEGALEKVRKGNLLEASRLINISLQNFPRQPYLHILNGVIYERMAAAGFDGKAELAVVAYQSALNLDPTNWYAVYFTGRLKLKNQDYPRAQEYLANALLLKPNDPMVLHDLAVASYYARDLDLARASIQRALKLKPSEPLFNRSAAVIFAATGERQVAEQYLNVFKQNMNPADPDVAYVIARIQDWDRVHVSKNLAPAAASTPSTATSPQENPPNDLENHIILDCYLLRVSDETKTSKGWNVLTSFQNNLMGLTIKPRTITHSDTKTFDISGPVTGVLTKTFAGSISVDSINYNLNIANAFDNRIETLGRPTLSASLNKKATFSSGNTIKGGIQGTIGGSLGDIPTGTILQVTPTKMVGDFLTLDISLEGSLLVNVDTNAALTNQLIQIAQTKVVTTLRLKFGETGMLGGMYERTDQYTKTGFPLLQDIPAVQYLFSNEITDSLRQSVLFLVTPRRAETVHKQVVEHFKGSPSRWEKQPSIKELLKQDGGAWNVDAVPPALITILYRTQNLYYQFRSGDLISTPFWGLTPTLEDELDQISSFLYY